MFGLGLPELLVIMVIILILFGTKKLPEIGSSIGKGLKSFKKEINDVKDSIENASEIDIKADGPKKA